MKPTAVEFYREEYKALVILRKSKFKTEQEIFDQAKEMEKIEKLKRQLFIGKVQEIIGFEKTIELLKECNEIFKDAAL
jgi:hypothetical protein